MEFQEPKLGAKVRVIGAGLPRTGTTSFCAALAILLDGPPYHAGVQYINHHDESHVLALMDVADRRPSRSAEEKQLALDKLAARLDGYVATADPPLSQLVPELMKIYPDAKVICTTREKESWVESIMFTKKLIRERLFRFLLFWNTGLRYLASMNKATTRMFVERYGIAPDSWENIMLTYERHHAWLEQVVPKEKLFYVDVRDGWPPLCKALGLPLPENVAFPRLNDGEGLQATFQRIFKRGLQSWALVFAAIALFVIVLAELSIWGLLRNTKRH